MFEVIYGGHNMEIAALVSPDLEDEIKRLPPDDSTTGQLSGNYSKSYREVVFGQRQQTMSHQRVIDDMYNLHLTRETVWPLGSKGQRQGSGSRP